MTCKMSKKYNWKFQDNYKVELEMDLQMYMGGIMNVL